MWGKRICKSYQGNPAKVAAAAVKEGASCKEAAAVAAGTVEPASVLPTKDALLADREKALATLAGASALVASSEGVWSSDGERLEPMASVAKARKMLCRALRWLNQGQSKAFLLGAMRLLKEFAARGDPDSVANAKTLRESKELWWESMLDERFCQALVGCATTAIGGGPHTDPTLPIEAMKTFLDAHMSGSYNDRVKKMMETRGVSMVIQAITMHGQQLSAMCANPQIQGAWMEQYQRFVAIMS